MMTSQLQKEDGAKESSVTGPATDDVATLTPAQAAKQRAVVRRGSQARRVVRNRIPDDILNNAALHQAIQQGLPSNYSFEIPKTVWKIRDFKANSVALQFPEGLLMYACIISDILERFAGCRCVILGDVTYGACCIDDLTARALGCDLLVHYGHSCLVPIAVTTVKTLYVFVEIGIDVPHLCGCIRKTFDSADTHLALLGTIQFSGAVHEAKNLLGEFYSDVIVPQAKPLSPGEVLGCTSPILPTSCNVMIFVADGRFHLEAAMIQNPQVQAYRYNPYTKVLTREYYEIDRMRSLRDAAVTSAKEAAVVGIILGTLGRQGNPTILNHVKALLASKGKRTFVLLLSEVFPAKLALLNHVVDAWVQIACPRLSVDWGHYFDKPLLTAYEAEVAFGVEEWGAQYPMDFYKMGSGPWTNKHAIAPAVAQPAGGLGQTKEKTRGDVR